MDCVWQILRQAPLLFEVSSFVELTLASIDMFCVYQFTEEFLMAILDHLYDCRFGTFLFNSEAQRVNAKCKERTESLWSYLLSSEQSDLYMNYLFHYCDRKETVMQISTDPRRLILWEAYHLR
mmetsp:Transcript_25581/g.41028  ORF Transcript_25581/g.41028 Transcript_25581/m.41028 type:complete len:123 (-) Transcript_25581:49-417(-)